MKRLHCDPPMDIPNGMWMSLNINSENQIGSHVVYECEAGYKAIGNLQIECLETGYWSDLAPRCLPRGIIAQRIKLRKHFGRLGADSLLVHFNAESYCDQPERVENGFYMCEPSHCNLFHVGTEIHYKCQMDHVAGPEGDMIQTCMQGGQWSGTRPRCIPSKVSYIHR